jgi:type II secretory pathway pseudopilin PulG
MKQRGFTIIGVLILVAILGILLAVIIPNVWAFQEQSRDEAARVEGQSIDLTITGTVVTIKRSDEYSTLFFSDGAQYILVTNESLDLFRDLLNRVYEYQLHYDGRGYVLIAIK